MMAFPLPRIPRMTTLRGWTLLFAVLIGQAAAAQEESQAWEGIWSADEGEFIVRVAASGRSLVVLPIAPQGVAWSATNGVIEGESVTIEAEFQGVYGTVLVELTGEDTAIARSLSCQPDYHFICTLARNQQVRFRRLD